MATHEMTAREELMVSVGRLHGLCGTIRYDLPDEFRAELRAAVDKLEETIKRLPH